MSTSFHQLIICRAGLPPPFSQKISFFFQLHIVWLASIILVSITTVLQLFGEFLFFFSFFSFPFHFGNWAGLFVAKHWLDIYSFCSLWVTDYNLKIHIRTFTNARPLHDVNIKKNKVNHFGQSTKTFTAFHNWNTQRLFSHSFPFSDSLSLSVSPNPFIPLFRLLPHHKPNFNNAYWSFNKGALLNIHLHGYRITTDEFIHVDFVCVCVVIIIL